MNRYARPENFGHPIRNPLLREHFVYRAFDALGRLLYVGCSARLEGRMQGHRTSSQWWPLAARFTMAGPFNYETARAMEHEAIESERPQFNYTVEHRLIDHMRRRMIDRQMSALVAAGMNWTDAIHPAVEAVDSLIPPNKGRVIDDLTIPTYRRIEREHAASLGGAA